MEPHQQARATPTNCMLCRCAKTLFTMSILFNISSSFRIPKNQIYGSRSLLLSRNWGSRQATNPTLLKKAWMQAATLTEEASPKHKLVIVESPAKAKTIQKLLDAQAGKGQYLVDFCAGHVRDLPSSAREVPPEIKEQKWPVLGINVSDDFEPFYVTKADKEPVLKRLRKECKSSSEVVLATDEDREGEAISWHLLGALEPKVPVKRVVFHEITKDAIDRAFANPREIDSALVNAQEARRILDRLAGYTMSPLLWRKITPGLSAGRVQSVGLGMIIQRERERLVFKSATFWDITAVCESASDGSQSFPAKMIEVNGKKLATGRDFNSQGVLEVEKAMHLHQDGAEDIARKLEAGSTTWRVSSVETRSSSRGSPVPFITSTLQQEANRKLGLSPSDTMKVAQRLYESGHITYMRTDNPQLSEQATEVSKQQVRESFGENYVASEERKASSKKPKNAQEAHEAIRPAFTDDDTFIAPEKTVLSDLERKLYSLIYKRTLASVMKRAELEFTTVKIEAKTEDDLSVTFRSSGKYIKFPGFLKAYEDGKDNNDVLLPALKKDQLVNANEIEPQLHATQPPARFSEASFIKELEARGVGRPSTYAKIMETLKEREYVKVEKSTIIPSMTSFVVISFLEEHFPDYVDTGFTAQMEDALDKIAAGQLEKEGYLGTYFLGEKGLKSKVDRGMDIIDPAESRRARLPNLEDLEEDIGVFISKWGPYIELLNTTAEATAEKASSSGRAITPIPLYMQYEVENLTPEMIHECVTQNQNNGVHLGTHPETGEEIKIKIGRYGAYLEASLPEDESKSQEEKDGKKKKPRTFALPRGSAMEEIGLEDALRWLSLPRVVCAHPETGKNITSSYGRFGPYVYHNGVYASLRGEMDPFTVTTEQAIDLINKKIASSGTVAELGEYEGSQVLIKNGRFGAYIKWNKINGRLPAEYKDDPSSCPLQLAIKILEERGAGKKKKTTKGKQKTEATKKSKKTSYQIFMAEKRAELKNEGLSFGDITKQIASLWKECDDSEKAVYKQRADELNAQHAEDSGEKKQSKEVSKKKRTAYQCFTAKKRPEFVEEGLSFGEITKRVSSLWKETSDEDRLQYQQIADKYNEEQGIAPSPTKALKGTVKKRTGYQIFTAETRPGIASEGLSFGEVTKKTAALWKELSDPDKQKYQQLAAEYNSKISVAEDSDPLPGGKSAKSKAKSSVAKIKKSTNSENKVKRPRSAYLFFTSEKRSSEFKKLKSLGEVAKSLSAKWKSLTEKEKEPYVRMSDADKERYRAEIRRQEDPSFAQ